MPRALILLVAMATSAAAASGSGAAFLWKKRATDQPTELIMFYAKRKDMCQQMEPLMREVEKDVGKRIVRFDAGKMINYELLVHLDDKDECGGLPYYYNRATHRAICGATTYDNLLTWAEGGMSKLRAPPPISKKYREEMRAKMIEENVYDPPIKETGLKGRILRKLNKLKFQGQGQMVQ